MLELLVLQGALAAAKKWQQELQTVEDSARQREESLRAEVAQLQARLQDLTAELRKARHAGKEQQAQQSVGRENLGTSTGLLQRDSQASNRGQGRSPQVGKGSGEYQELDRLPPENSMQRCNSTAASRMPLQASN